MIEDVMFRCEACTTRAVTHPRVWDLDLNVDVNNLVSLKTPMPKDWKHSFGSNGRGSFHLCPDCSKNGARIDNEKGVIIVWGDS